MGKEYVSWIWCDFEAFFPYFPQGAALLGAAEELAGGEGARGEPQVALHVLGRQIRFWTESCPRNTQKTPRGPNDMRISCRETKLWPCSRILSALRLPPVPEPITRDLALHAKRTRIHFNPQHFLFVWHGVELARVRVR